MLLALCAEQCCKIDKSKSLITSAHSDVKSKSERLRELLVNLLGSMVDGIRDEVLLQKYFH